jgi:hypothetical protein
MKGLSQDERRGFNKYKLNYNYISYNDKTGFYRKTTETSAGRGRSRPRIAEYLQIDDNVIQCT